VRASGGEASDQLLLANRAHPTGNALAARFVAEEGGDPAERADEVGRLVEDHHDAGAERRPDGPGPLEGERRRQGVRSDEAPGGSPEQDRPDWTGRPAGEVEQPAEGRPEGDLVGPWPADVAGQAEQLRPGRILGPGRGEGRSAVGQDEGHVGQGLDVVDRGRLAEQADLDRERRLVAGLAPAALDRVE
jgi:hypothetical protein